MIDGLTHDLNGAVIEEVEKLTGFTISREGLIDLTELASRDSRRKKTENSQASMYLTTSGRDESIALYLWEQSMDGPIEIEDL